jgi:hypothetical protein
MEAQPGEDAEIEATKGELEVVQAMKDELAAAVAASDFERVQVLAKRLKVKELQQQLGAAVASDNFPEVARLGKELDEYTNSDAQPLAQPVPEPEPATDLGAAAVWGSAPNDGAAAAYRAWEEDLVASEITKQMGLEAEDDSETVDPDEMAALQFLDEPELLAPTVAVVEAGEDNRPEARVRWRVVGPHREDPARLVEMTTSRFRMSFKHSTWWTWQYSDVILNETPDCMRIAESEDGSCEFILRGEPGQLEQPGEYSIAIAPLYEFVEEWSVREWSESTTFVLSPTGGRDGAAEMESWCIVQ